MASDAIPLDKFMEDDKELDFKIRQSESKEKRVNENDIEDDFDNIEIFVGGNEIKNEIEDNNQNGSNIFDESQDRDIINELEKGKNQNKYDMDDSDIVDLDSDMNQARIDPIHSNNNILQKSESVEDTKAMNILMEIQFEEASKKNTFVQQQQQQLPNSYQNYQVSMINKAANKKKPSKQKTIGESRNKLKETLNIESDDIGEVGEWVGKSANANNVKEDSEDEDEKSNNSDDFDGIFDNGSKEQKPKSEKNKKDHVFKPESQKDTADQSNKAMLKAQAQNSALKIAKKKGPFANNLIEKAKNIQNKQGDDKPVEKKLKEIISEEEEDEKEEKVEKIKESLPKDKKIESEVPTAKAKQNANSVEPLQPKKEILEEKKIEVEQNPEDIDWDMISKSNMAKLASEKDKQKEVKIVSFMDAWSHFKSLSLADEKKTVQKDIDMQKTWVERLFGSCNSNGLPPPLANERDQILALTKVQFSDDDEMHYLMLSTIYNKATNAEEFVPRFGSHWVKIGFQGKDPATDLRGVGILGLLQILAFSSFHLKLFREIWELSNDEKLNFPMCLSMLEISLSTMQMLREGKLNSKINAQKSVINVFNDLYFAGFYKLYKIYKDRGYSIENYPIAKREAVELLKTNPNQVLKDFFQTLS